MTDPLFDLEGRVAIVTGGLGQLGSVYAAGLAERGMRVAVFDVERGEVPDGVRAYEVDVTDRFALEEAEKEVERAWGVPHLLVNNAALDSPPDAPAEEVGPFETYPEESFAAVMDVNVKGTFLCCQVVGAAMAREGRGSIVNISSVNGLGTKSLAPASSTAAALRGSLLPVMMRITVASPPGSCRRRRPATGTCPPW